MHELTAQELELVSGGGHKKNSGSDSVNVGGVQITTVAAPTTNVAVVEAIQVGSVVITTVVND